jgi:hypothetical protein
MPPIPNLLHKTRIVIRPQDTTNTAYDDDAREAIQVVKKRNDVPIQGQVSFKGAGRGDNTQEYQRRGVDETGKGYILFRYIDLKKLGIELKPNDQIVQIGHKKVDLWIERLQDEGHYADQDGAALVKAHLQDRKPARNTPGE